MALIDDFKARFPEFDTTVVDEYLPTLEPVWPCYFGGAYTDCNKETILNLLGHLLVAETNAGTGSPKSTQSKSVGSVSISYSSGYAPTTQRDAWLKTTKYGARYMWLTSSNIGGFFV